MRWRTGFSPIECSAWQEVPQAAFCKPAAKEEPHPRCCTTRHIYPGEENTAPWYLVWYRLRASSFGHVHRLLPCSDLLRCPAHCMPCFSAYATPLSVAEAAPVAPPIEPRTSLRCLPLPCTRSRTSLRCPHVTVQCSISQSVRDAAELARELD
jgi:hypothetical protein